MGKNSQFRINVFLGANIRGRVLLRILLQRPFERREYYRSVDVGIEVNKVGNIMEALIEDVSTEVSNAGNTMEVWIEDVPK